MNNNFDTINLISRLLQKEKERLNKIDLKLKIINVYNNDIKLDLDIISMLIIITDRCLITGQTSRALKYIAALKYRADLLDLNIGCYNEELSKRFLK